jgi:prepilin-type N-terminal cleavage/methylation domain-containing protein
MMHAAEEHGFTLVELLVAMALAMIVFGATLTAFDVFQTNNRFDLLRNEAQDNARNAIDRLARELRNVAAPSTKEAGALEQAVTPAEEKEGKPASIIFQTISSSTPKGANTTNAMRVRYCLNDSTPSNEILYRQAQTWETEVAPALPSAKNLEKCPDEAGDFQSTTQLVRYITNKNGGQSRALFAYGSASEVSKIVTVEPTLYLNVNPSQPLHPGETQLTSGITLRNANRQPVAAFTATEKNGHILLNASESTDPDGLALTYKWSEGTTEEETPIASTSQQYETPTALVSKSVHTFWLKVTDPGGLTASTKKTVTLK